MALRDGIKRCTQVSRDAIKKASNGKFCKQHCTFFRLHLLYFLVLAMFGTFILHEIGIKKGVEFKWIDSLFCFTSAICLSGLSTVAIEDMRTGCHVILLLGMVLGGQIFTSVVPLLVKKHRYFGVVKQIIERPSSERSSFSRSDPHEPVPVLPREDPGNNPLVMIKKLSKSMLLKSEEDKWMDDMAVKHHDSKMEQGGGSIKEIVQEYRATTALIKLVVYYYLLVNFVGFLVSWISILASPHSKHVLKAKGIDPAFFAIFAVVSGFANCGYILANENMVALNTNSVLLLTIFVVVLLGNTLYPSALRFLVWIMFKVSKSRKKDAYRFLLEHPRKCYTHLFPKSPTLWLTLVVGVLVSFQAVMFLCVDWNGKALQGLSSGHKILSGLFDASGTRSSGMNSVVLVDVSPGILLLYSAMMYISAYPIFLSRQNTRIQEEASKGSMGDLHDITISTQSRRLFAKDWTYLFLALFLVCIFQNKQFKRDPINFSIFNTMFEIISAYGCVGLSIGYSCSLRTQPGLCVDVPYSFSGKWNYISKVFLIIVMFLGRHRGLPDNIDSAIILPEHKYGSMVLKSQEQDENAVSISVHDVDEQTEAPEGSEERGAPGTA